MSAVDLAVYVKSYYCMLSLCWMDVWSC